MKKTYIKPNLRVELFEVDTIMTDVGATPSPLVASNILQGSVTIPEAGTINFNDNNRLESINYQDFLSQN